MTDPISDMLTRIRNAQAVSHKTVSIPFSKLKFSLAQVFEKSGFVGAVSSQGKKINKTIKIVLKYEENQSVIRELKRISKQGQRIYIKKGDIKPVRHGYGLAVISTSKGLMTSAEARKKGFGGEVICEIW
ncbi:30S ribosomal protein S8 [Patescibacteria group bacterium]|nr:30S ribosomal protein S8 [Patescibacteria group bacterium]MBU2579748.1 30S ribosomal protein S8 [Patescibacteria group bacterium]MBU4031034.1 30S ribosomal protein S8 [Patescibacteria group bacterium]MBU4082834.1 30S ribosomal protein S8 [Patescibacteria group bacterium]MCG2809403.1 30S ribosomal protein S8 [Candidatus Portnoybacteria bacterium]